MSSSIRKSHFPLIVTLLTVAFLYFPLLMVGVASFNSSKFGGRWQGFTFSWYDQLFREGRIWAALGNTLIIACIATLISTVLGTMCALVLYRTKSRLRGIGNALVQTSIVVPDILNGIGLLLLFVLISSICGPVVKILTGMETGLGMTTIIIAHVTFCMSYVTMVVLGRLQAFDNSLVEAAKDLGAGSFYTFFHVTLPVILPGIIAGALFAFTLSIDDFVITFFVKGAGDTTLPVYIEGAMKKGRKIPVLNALSVLFLLFTFMLVFYTKKILTPKQERQN